MLTTVRPREQSGGLLRERARQAMNGLLIGQTLAALALVLVVALWSGMGAAYSVLVGTVIAIAPNYYLAARLMRRKPGTTPSESLRGIYTGELLKIAFTIALFVIAIRLLDVMFLTVVASYLVMAAVNWLALLYIDVGEQPRSSTARAGSSL